MGADGRGRGTLRIHVPRIETQDLDPESSLAIVGMSKASPAILVDGRPADPRPEDAKHARLDLPLAAGEHRVEVMVKQSYETVAVDVRPGRTTDLHIGYLRDRHGEDRLHVGTEEHVRQALAPAASPSVVSGVRWGCGTWFPLLIAGAVAGTLLRDRFGWSAGAVAIAVIGAATALALLAAAVAAISRRGPRADPAATAPEPVTLAATAAGPVLLVPAAAAPPGGAGVLLRVRARPRTLHMIGFDKRLRDTIGLGHYEFYWNEFADWVDAPRVHLDGEPLGAGWGTWWIPCRPGARRLRVQVGGIRDPRGDGPAGSAFEAETAVDVPDGAAVEITAWFNFLDLVNERERAHPGAVSRWQRVMRSQDRYRPLSEQAAAEPGLEFTRGREQPR
ncbi:hypothetical protein [Glycomyces harbinensis]|uniref:Uncharacterized protein n=1 Tax=Glycomyces harbinensis TaxID=58114 RepID=A0A1G6TUG8_9ACTN|nr:hypothetical protein [Glycomyces harbinensis]SDD32584.1 hypothetical protein SAMN05216270_103155 [Glycomyces harbinensis]